MQSHAPTHLALAASVLLAALAITPLASMAALTHGFVACWNFDSGFEAAAGGRSFDSVPNGDPVSDSGGRLNSAVRFTRELSQHLEVSAPVMYPSGHLAQGCDHTITPEEIAAVPEHSISRGFTEIEAGLPGVRASSAAWGDYDNDGDLDILLAGQTGSGNISRVYRNDAGSFTDIGAGLPGVYWGAAAWGDYDNDGDLDILLTGDTGSARVSCVFRNNAGTFADIGAGLPGVCYSSVAWGDYDNDGDLDILMAGQTGSGNISRVYRNDAGSFTDIGAGLLGVRFSAVAWGDYDNDGDLDILLTGETDTGRISRVYGNSAGTFTDIGAALPGVRGSAVAWGDYDSDGDLDILLTGDTGSGYTAGVYRNNAGTFADIGAALTGVVAGAAAWGDYDNDGDLDILLSGVTGGAPPYISQVYHNEAGTFTDIGAGLPGVYNSSMAWGDYDSDGDLDILLTGNTGSGYAAGVYRSDGVAANTPPNAPGGLSASVVGDRVTLSWSAATDAETPAAGLSYNLRIGTTPEGNEIVSAMADGASGYRRVVALGNVQQRTTWTLTLPPGGRIYYWSLQALDGTWTGSEFAEEGSFARVEFADMGAGLPGVSRSSVAWGDYDNDGDLDILLTGDTGSGRTSGLYRNDAGAFSDLGVGLVGVSSSAVAWGDYDNDGDLDILLTGDTGSVPTARVYRNNGGTFTDIGAALLGVRFSAVAWGDYDNDGDLDILLTGLTNSGALITRVYRNDEGVFTSLGPGLPGVRDSAVAWGDYDNDGDLDILLTGDTESGLIARVYVNNAGTFTDIGAGLTGVRVGAVAWGDYDNDGDLDILLSGATGGTPAYISRVYRNDSGAFTDIAAGLPGVYSGSVAWGDCDNDGDPDIVLAGETGAGRISRVYRNNAGTFTDVAAGLPGVLYSSVVWGDYDNDGDLDVLLTGDTGSEFLSRVYRSVGAMANTPPTAPGGLSASVSGHRVTLCWSEATDVETPADGLSYNLRIGTTPGGNEITSAMADGASGYRRVVGLGNAQQRTAWTVTLPPGGYYWSVQALDGAWAGSTFAEELGLQVVSFTDVAAGLPGVSFGSAVWGDYDNDGDLDLVLTGHTGSAAISRVYRNDAGVFTDIGAGLTGVYQGAVTWGDYDNDGDLDILLTGDAGSTGVSRVYRNDAGTFIDSAVGLPGVWSGSVAWGDYDNDGDLDLVLTGYTGSTAISRVYRNDAGTFTDIGAGLPGVSGSSVAWGDFDNDSDLDLVLTGGTDTVHISRVYRNDAGTFTDIGAGLPGVRWGSAAWGDYDNDGDLDLVLVGWHTDSNGISRVYRNDAGTFTNIGAGLPGICSGSAAWGDHDNDGDLDVVLTGGGGSGYTSRVYRNDAGTFTNIGAGLPGAEFSSAAWGDYDNDGDLDVLLTGFAGSGEYLSRVYRSDGAPANTPPTAPGDLSASSVDDQVTLSWSAATDAETPAAGLSYNLRIGTTPGGDEITSAMADGASGLRRVVALGNAQQRTAWTVTLPLGCYYWSVQALDGAWAGSAFAEEQVLDQTSAVREELPRELSFVSAGANPTAGAALLCFGLPAPARVELSVYDIAGRRVASLVSGDLSAGYHTVSWIRAAGGDVPGAGVYFARLMVDGRVSTRKLVVTR